jgi:hypothetical protein
MTIGEWLPLYLQNGLVLICAVQIQMFFLNFLECGVSQGGVRPI